MSLRTPEPCGQSPCDALQEISHLLPSGPIWQVGGDTNLSRFWCGIAEAKSCLMDALCQEWKEADPCTSSRTLQRWADVHCFPSDCVDLTADKLCEWIEFIDRCEAGTEGFVLGLLDFVSVDLTGLQVKFSDCCENLFGQRCGACITICGPLDALEEQHCDCNSNLFEILNNPCGKLVVPEIECLRRYFPVGVQVKYEVTDCDPNLIRHIRET